jgi:hypothetical protein
MLEPGRRAIIAWPFFAHPKSDSALAFNNNGPFAAITAMRTGLAYT